MKVKKKRKMPFMSVKENYTIYRVPHNKPTMILRNFDILQCDLNDFPKYIQEANLILTGNGFATLTMPNSDTK